MTFWMIQVKITLDRRQSKMLILSTNVDQKSSVTDVLIVICRPTGDKWQSKTLFLAFFDPHSSSVKSIFDCHLSGVIMDSKRSENNLNKNAVCCKFKIAFQGVQDSLPGVTVK